MKIIRTTVITFAVILSIYLITYADSSKDKKIYGPVLHTMSDEVVMTGGDEFSQRYLQLDESSFFGELSDVRPIYSVDVKDDKSKYISLTFDSSWNDEHTIPLLNVLDEYGAKATFFLTAFYIWEHQESVKEILRRGHEIGNHSNKHVRFNEQDEKRIISEIEKCHSAIKEVTGVDACLFRFPYGAYNELSMKLLRERGYYSIQWTNDSLDWKNESAEAIIKKLGKDDSYNAGNIILFHNGADYTVEALKTILLIIKQKGLKCVRVSDLIYEKNFYVNKMGMQIEKISQE